ncbi:sugar-binding protein [Leeuwenhoekiella palythoae]|uniref:sugar-binding protein n=1 Tax=Leeuwenhoekiella palythoae TaxID=573501 RepID=UPI0035138DEB
MNNTKYIVGRIQNGSSDLREREETNLWDSANELTNFVSPWDKQPIKPITFKALYDTDYFYFSFSVEDDTVFTELKDDSKPSIAQSDRVELFIREDAQMCPYYCLEIDTQPRIMDFKAMPNRNFDLSWNWPEGEIDVKSSVLKDHFKVEGKISLKSLKALNLLKQDARGTFMEIGVYRAKYNQDEMGNNQATWITWVDPKTPEPEFHIADSFGIFRFES